MATATKTKPETKLVLPRPSSVVELLNRTVTTTSTEQSSSPVSQEYRSHQLSEALPPTDLPETSSDWEMPRFGDLEKKRLSLCQQRVRLERRLFEVSRDHDAPASMNLDLNEKNAFDALLVKQKGGKCCGSTHVTQFVVRFKQGGHAYWTGPVTLVAVDGDENENGTTERYINNPLGEQTARDFLEATNSLTRKVLKPNGHGTMVYSNGQVYDGYVVNGMRHGFGKNTWPDGQMFMGGWQENSRTGRGSHMWPDGKTVTGQWTDGHLNGRCFFQWPDGATYDGDTLNGKKHGKGVHTWSDGKVYKGQYEHGFEHGFGTLTEASGVCRYRGQFRHGQRHGFGTQIWQEKTYEGEWRYNTMEGTGKLTWKNGAVYQGQFQHGRFHGHQGCYVDKSGRKYVGSWVHGQKEGSGRETWPQTGQSYVGSYLQGKKHGFGRLVQGDGSMYAGGWKLGKRSGRGIFVKSNGDILHCGLWEKDRPVLIDSVSSPSSSLGTKQSRECVESHVSTRKVSFMLDKGETGQATTCHDAAPLSAGRPSSMTEKVINDDSTLFVPFAGQRRLHLRVLPGQTTCHHDAEFIYIFEDGKDDSDELVLSQTASSMSNPSKSGKSSSWEI